MLQEAAFSEELADLTLEDVLDDVRWLTLGGEAGAEDVQLVVDHRLRDVIAGQALRRASSDVEGEVLDELLEAVGACGFRLGGADFDQHAHLATEVDVGSDHAAWSCVVADVLAELEVFTDFADFRFDRVFDGLFAVLGGEGGIEVSCAGGSERIGDASNKGLEAFVFRNEVRFAVHFQQQAGSGTRVDAGGDDAFLGSAVGHLAGLHDAALAEELDGGFDVAVGFGEDFFAVHHGGAGLIAEFFDD